MGVALLLLAVACTGPEPRASSPSAGSSAGVASGGQGEFRLPPPRAGPGSAAAVRTSLCRRPPAPDPAPSPPPGQQQPAGILDAERAVQEFRELTFISPVTVRRVNGRELADVLERRLDRTDPPDLARRRSQAWSTIGVVPSGTDLRAAQRAYDSRMVASYDVDTNVLSLLDGPLDPAARYGLVHGLALALDDQRFELSRFDAVLDSCREDAVMGAAGAVEGSAGFFSRQVALRTFAPGEHGALERAAVPARPSGVPPFVHALRTWADVVGPRFAAEVTDVGEIEAINEPLSRFPPSSEQVIHPEKLFNDAPVPVEVPDLGPALGSGWRDLDVMDVGEAWLGAMLGFRLDPAAAAKAAAGWGGGQYRAWTDGSHTVVVLVTAWDTPGDAAEFLVAAERWTGYRHDAAAGTTDDPSVVVATFASDPATLDLLNGALS